MNRSMANPNPNIIENHLDDSLAAGLLPTVSRPENTDGRVAELVEARVKLEEQVRKIKRRLRRQEREINQEWQHRLAREGMHASTRVASWPVHHSISSNAFIKKVPISGSRDK